jgi:hypothetical protein
MARRITVNLSDTINTWRIKTNTLSNLIGDLDDLSSEFNGHDSDFVEAMNFAFDKKGLYTAGLGITKSTSGDSSGAFTVLAGTGLTQDSNGLSIGPAPGNTIKVRDANSAGALSDKEIINEQILIGNGNGFTSAALSQDVLMTNAGVVTIQPDVVTYSKMQNVVGANKVLGSSTANGIITETQVQTGMIADDAVTTVKILDDNVTYAKIQDAGANSILVRDGAAAGDISAKTLTDTQILINNGAGFTAAALSGDITMNNAGVVTVDPSVIGSVGITIGGNAPTSPANGTAWFDDVTAGEMFVYSDSASNWIQVTGSITSFSAISGTPPAAPLDGTFWFDDVTDGELFIYSDSASNWIQVTGSITSFSTIGASPPAAPLNGTFWFDDSATGELFIYSNDASNWIQVTGVVANVAFSDLTSTPTTLAGYGITDAPSVLTDLSITDGTSGQVLTTDGSAGFTFTSASSSTTFNAIGTYCLGFYTGLGIHNGGATFSGSSIATANTYAGTSGWSGSSTSTLSGTWRLMGNIGYYNQGTTASNANVSGSLFVRIS